jgi:hypothetical protein
MLQLLVVFLSFGGSRAAGGILVPHETQLSNRQSLDSGNSLPY